MNFLAWIIFGALAGWIASIVTGHNVKMGAIANIVVGIVGAFIGGFIFDRLGGAGITGFNIWSLFVAVVGSVVLLWLLNIFNKK